VKYFAYYLRYLEHYVVTSITLENCLEVYQTASNLNLADIKTETARFISSQQRSVDMRLKTVTELDVHYQELRVHEPATVEKATAISSSMNLLRTQSRDTMGDKPNLDTLMT
jgi:hypothetical protein